MKMKVSKMRALFNARFNGEDCTTVDGKGKMNKVFLGIFLVATVLFIVGLFTPLTKSIWGLLCLGLIGGVGAFVFPHIPTVVGQLRYSIQECCAGGCFFSVVAQVPVLIGVEVCLRSEYLEGVMGASFLSLALFLVSGLLLGRYCRSLQDGTLDHADCQTEEEECTENQRDTTDVPEALTSHLS